jgi:hypothetical protein
MATPPPRLPTITLQELLLELFQRTGDRDTIRSVGDAMRERARLRELDASNRRFLRRAGEPGLPFEGTTDERGTETNPFSEEDAQALFDEIGALDTIPFDYPVDGCFARAHAMARHIQERGAVCAKVWNHGVDKFLVVPGTEFGDIEWHYHVAVVVCVEGSDGQVRQMVIDPSLARGDDARPLTLDEWVALQGGPEGQQARITSAAPYRYDPTRRGDPTFDYGTITMDPGYESTDATLEYMSVQRDLIRVGRRLTPPEDVPDRDLMNI